MNTLFAEFDHLLRGGHAPTLFAAAAVIAVVMVLIAAGMNLLGQQIARWRWRRQYAERQPIPITDARRQPRRALSTERIGR